jgi:hypothetical protein
VDVPDPEFKYMDNDALLTVPDGITAVLTLAAMELMVIRVRNVVAAP